MSALIRFGISLEKDLLVKFDSVIREGKYANRSEAFRDLMRGELVKKAWKAGDTVAGAITLIYDHHRRALLNKITDVQHDFQGLIIASQHVHLDHYNCLEIVAVKGEAQAIQKLADTLRAIKGVKHGTLSMTGCGKD